jgi:hypothetical protein
VDEAPPAGPMHHDGSEGEGRRSVSRVRAREVLPSCRRRATRARQRRTGQAEARKGALPRNWMPTVPRIRSRRQMRRSASHDRWSRSCLNCAGRNREPDRLDE